MDELNDSEFLHIDSETFPGTIEEYINKYQAFHHLEADEGTGDGEVYIFGSHHRSLESAEAIGYCLSFVNPDIIGLEFCDERYFNKSLSVSRPMFSVRTGVIYMAKLAQKFTSRLNPVPDGPKGGEFKITFTIAEEKDIPIALIDKSYSSIASDLVERPSLREVFQTLSGLTGLDIILPDKTGDLNMEAVVKQNTSREESFPTSYKVLVEERNAQMAKNIRALRAEYETACIIMGAAHIPGVLERLGGENAPSADLSEIEIVEN